jgi:branched-chain amino acid transport system permease protein
MSAMDQTSPRFGGIPMPKGFAAWFAVGVVIFLALLPPLTELIGESFYLKIGTRIVIMAIAAVGLNLILGYGGMVSFGHAAYIGIGAYCAAIPIYHGYEVGLVHILMAIFFSALFALVTGAISLRTKGVHFIMITLAFSQMAYYFFISLEGYGGDDGLPLPFGSNSEFPLGFDISDRWTLYYTGFVSLMLAVYLKYRLVNSRFGRVIRGSKSNERRMMALGYPTYRYRLTAYVISGAICGYAGVLLVNYTTFISPEMMGWTRSGELIFMVVLGGTATLFGPIYGVMAFILMSEFLPEIMDSFYEGAGTYWLLPFGIFLVVVVLFTQGGINGLLRWVGQAGAGGGRK